MQAADFIDDPRVVQPTVSMHKACTGKQLRVGGMGRLMFAAWTRKRAVKVGRAGLISRREKRSALIAIPYPMPLMLLFTKPETPFRHRKLAVACIALVFLAACDLTSLLSPGDQMFAAAHEGDTQKIKELLASGKIKNIDETFGGSEMTALQRAVQKRHYDVIALLIGAGANVNRVTIFGTTALHIAAYQGDHRAAEMLIVAGADVNVREQHSFTPLHDALEKAIRMWQSY